MTLQEKEKYITVINLINPGNMSLKIKSVFEMTTVFVLFCFVLVFFVG